MDEFAQTRGADDLFDDEIIPVSEDQVVDEHAPAADLLQPPQHDALTENLEKLAIDSHAASASAATAATAASATTAATAAAAATTTAAAEPAQWSRGTDRTRGRGKGRGARGGHSSPANGATQQRPRPDSDAMPKQPANSASDAATTALEGTDIDAHDASTPPPGDGEPISESKSATAAAVAAAVGGPEAARVPAVRGDRSATGGVKKPKLSEAELEQRMAAAKLKATERAAAHARAEADQASFLAREKVAAEKRRQEFKDRRAMDSERERNRQRKLEAVTGREWDATKREEDYNSLGRGGASQFRRGMHGGVSGYARRSRGGEDADNSATNANNADDNSSRRMHGTHPAADSSFRPRGRGGGGHHGKRGGTHGSKGGSNGVSNESPAVAGSGKKPTAVPSFDSDADFPPFPGSRATATTAAVVSSPKTLPAALDAPSQQVTGSTWAEQMEPGLASPS